MAKMWQNATGGGRPGGRAGGGRRQVAVVTRTVRGGRGRRGGGRTNVETLTTGQVVRPGGRVPTQAQVAQARARRARRARRVGR